MTAQMRRCSVSIASNIAEGAAGQGNKEFVQFLHIALGPAAELETQFVIAREVKLLQTRTFEDLDRQLPRIRLTLRGGLTRSVKAS